MIKRIAEYYHVSIDYLIGRSKLKYDPENHETIKVLAKYTSLTDSEKDDFIKYINKYKKGR